MSDNIKLVIEIPKETVNEIKDNAMFAESIASQIKWDVTSAIVNGIPLDDVKAEIEKKCDRINSIASVLSYPQHREIQELLCEILASIGKAESEG